MTMAIDSAFDSGRPGADQPASDSYTPLAGSESRVESPRYRCPVASCHQTWYRHIVDEAIPHCPIHDVVMVRDSKVH
ncbi:hypothetical protein [Phormidium sp. FACHB-1136]|jgi:hypothetical protein|uniref:hypothetical protein n=1 Tax=Phormidium sp. FACHB-1136 TaxID=2692848 RepID=UPI00168427B5|nr:hypothetical protein [Phormidium sp. FACHB-1136]MBD2425117.1 hypothetical protein [Phormidium sp. FACHB-1136]